MLLTECGTCATQCARCGSRLSSSCTSLRRDFWFNSLAAGAMTRCRPIRVLTSGVEEHRKDTASREAFGHRRCQYEIEVRDRELRSSDAVTSSMMLLTNDENEDEPGAGYRVMVLFGPDPSYRCFPKNHPG